ncbi:MAG TPA: KH domain-containing protein [Anaerolineales bacterium]|nr:KH domain-containing protein [Anaerolineales bacterium]
MTNEFPQPSAYNLLVFMLKGLVDYPDQISVEQIEGEGELIFEIQCADSDGGRIVGRQGNVIRALRILLNAALSQEGLTARLELLS